MPQVGTEMKTDAEENFSERRTRTGRDSNPRNPYGFTGFRDRLLQPLGHLSNDLDSTG